MTHDIQQALEAAPLIDAGEAARRAAHGALIIDVRGDEARARDGMVPGSIRADRDRLDAQFLPESADKLPEVTGLDQEIVVVCGSPRGSGPVAEHLRARGFLNVAHVDGGFPGWRDAGNPVTEAPASDGQAPA